ncbi:MAG: dihydrofolate reductase [Tannerella sp.]|jgi:dihydrofolate reductase|nr:dihydrofolate reductase [Tannerella sp.]
MSIISIIVATDEQGAIGKDRQLLWHLPRDLKHFKEITTGHTVIMGRKTFESLPGGALPNRRNIVLSADPDRHYAHCDLYRSLQEALIACEQEEEVFIIGGASVYRQAMAIAGKMYLTRVHHTYAEADAFFPPFTAEAWTETARQDFPPDDKNPYAHTFFTYVRKNNGYSDTAKKN